MGPEQGLLLWVPIAVCMGRGSREPEAMLLRQQTVAIIGPFPYNAGYAENSHGV